MRGHRARVMVLRAAGVEDPVALLKALAGLGWHLGYATSQPCRDCDTRFPEQYRVREDVWLQAWPNYVQERRDLTLRYAGTVEAFKQHLLLCFACLEARLGRKLVAADFDFDLPINYEVRKGLTLQLEHVPEDIAARRVDGRMICTVCDKPYQSHPLAPEYTDHNQEPYLNRLCNGELVKL